MSEVSLFYIHIRKEPFISQHLQPLVHGLTGLNLEGDRSPFMEPSGRARCGAGAGGSAMKYQSVCTEPNSSRKSSDSELPRPRRCRRLRAPRTPAGVRPVHLIIKMIKWIRTSRLSIKNTLSLPPTCCRLRAPRTPAESETSLLTTYWSESTLSP